jgi:hypothetical protein
MVFKKGNTGGPGRGHRKDKPIKDVDPDISDKELIDLLELAVRRGLLSSNLDQALVSARVGVNLAKLKGAPDKLKGLMSPGLVDMMEQFGKEGFKDDKIIDIEIVSEDD